jgi:hypothetical protein
MDDFWHDLEELRTEIEDYIAFILMIDRYENGSPRISLQSENQISLAYV